MILLLGVWFLLGICLHSAVTKSHFRSVVEFGHGYSDIRKIGNLDYRKFGYQEIRSTLPREKYDFKSKVVANYPAVRHNKHYKTNLRCTFGIEVGCYQARKSTLEKSMTSGVKL